MRIIKVELDKLDKTVLNIGWEGEQNHVQVQIQCGAFFAKYPNAGAGLTVLSPANVTYPVVLDKEGNDLIWDIDASDVVNAGSGKIQLTFTDGTGDDAEVIKTVIGSFNVNASLAVDGTAPDPIQHWIDQAEQTARQIAEESAIYAKEEIVESYGEIAPAIIETASGAIASLSDGASGMPVKTLTVEIEPVQDLHGYEYPWPAGGGTNKFNEDTELGGIGNNGVPYSSTGSIRSKTFSTCKGGTNYYILGTVAVYFYDSSENFIEVQYASNNVKTSPANAAYFKLGFYGTYGTTYKYDTAVNDPSSVTTYSPYSNVCPISGWDSANVSRTGVNVWDEETQVGYWNATTGVYIQSAGQLCSKNYIPVKPNTTYRNYKGATTNQGELIFFDADKGFISSKLPSAWINKEFTTPDNCYFMQFNLGGSYGATYNHDISINYPATDTQYHAYSGSTAEYEFPQEAGTVYGGSLTIHQDGSGELVVDHADLDLGTLTWARQPNKSVFRTNDEIVGMKPTTSTTVEQNIICDTYKTETWVHVLDSTGYDYCICEGWGGKSYVAINDTRYNDYTAEQFKSAMSGVHLVYELATPVTYQLTNQQVIALLKGSNNIWADTGDVAVEYPADTKLYIDGKVAELQALILENISNS